MKGIVTASTNKWSTRHKWGGGGEMCVDIYIIYVRGGGAGYREPSARGHNVRRTFRAYHRWKQIYKEIGSVAVRFKEMAYAVHTK